MMAANPDDPDDFSFGDGSPFAGAAEPTADQVPPPASPEIPYEKDGVTWDLSRADHFGKQVGRVVQQFSYGVSQSRQAEALATACDELEAIVVAMRAVLG